MIVAMITVTVAMRIVTIVAKIMKIMKKRMNNNNNNNNNQNENDWDTNKITICSVESDNNIIKEEIIDNKNHDSKR